MRKCSLVKLQHKDPKEPRQKQHPADDTTLIRQNTQCTCGPFALLRRDERGRKFDLHQKGAIDSACACVIAVWTRLDLRPLNAPTNVSDADVVVEVSIYLAAPSKCQRGISSAESVHRLLDGVWRCYYIKGQLLPKMEIDVLVMWRIAAVVGVICEVDREGRIEEC